MEGAYVSGEETAKQILSKLDHNTKDEISDVI
jgi:hypothetical protein